MRGLRWARHVVFRFVSGGSLVVALFGGGLVAALVAALSTAVPTAQAPTYTGYTKCGGSECHTKSGEIEWLTDKLGGKGHRNAFNKLRSTASADKTEKYSKAVGLEKYDDPKGMCVKCHGTYVEAAKTVEGVGCEGCHGAAWWYRIFTRKNRRITGVP